MIKPNQIVLWKDRFGDDLWDTVSKQIQILTKAGEVCVIYDDDIDIIIIQHQMRDTSSNYWGEPQPYWLDEKEQEIINNYRFEKSEENSSND